MSSSTVSTGLNKSKAIIKDNAIDIHTRELNFKNNEKIYLNEDMEIPTGKGIKHYIHCLTIGYYENYRQKWPIARIIKKSKYDWCLLTV